MSAAKEMSVEDAKKVVREKFPAEWQRPVDRGEGWHFYDGIGLYCSPAPTEHEAWVKMAWHVNPDAVQRILSAPQEPSVEQMLADLRVKWPNVWMSGYKAPTMTVWKGENNLPAFEAYLGSGISREAAIRDAWERHCKPSGVDLGDDEGEKVDHPNLHAELPHPLPQARAKWLCEHRSALPPEPAFAGLPSCGCGWVAGHRGKEGQDEQVDHMDAAHPDWRGSVPAPQSEVEVPKPNGFVVGDVWQTPTGTKYRIEAVYAEDIDFESLLDGTKVSFPHKGVRDWWVRIPVALPEEPKPKRDFVPDPVEWMTTIRNLLFTLGMKEEMSNWAGSFEGWGVAFEWIKYHVKRSQSIPPSSPAVSGTERERFEVWANPGFDLTRTTGIGRGYSDYEDNDTNQVWDAWQASLSGRDSSVVPERKFLVSASEGDDTTVDAKDVLREVHNLLCTCGTDDLNDCHTASVREQLLDVAISLLTSGMWNDDYEDGWISVRLTSSTSTHNEGRDGVGE